MTRPGALELKPTMQSTVQRTPIAVVFDLVGTLIYPEPSVAEVYFLHGRQFGSQFSRLEIARRIQSAQKLVNWEGADHLSQRRSWQQFVETVFQTTNQGLFESLWEHFAQARSWRLFDDVLPNLRRLRESGRRLAIGSNFDDRMFSICQGLHLTEAVDLVCGSSTLGYVKPNRSFFDALANRLGTAGQQTMMVGDDWDHDLAGALAAGWLARLLVRESEATVDQSTPEAIYRIGSLDELMP